jgi:hypothetical protein
VDDRYVGTGAIKVIDLTTVQALLAVRKQLVPTSKRDRGEKTLPCLAQIFTVTPSHKWDKKFPKANKASCMPFGVVAVTS